MKITKTKGKGMFWIILLLFGLILIGLTFETAALQNDSVDIKNIISPTDMIEVPEIIITTDEEFGPTGWNFPGDGSPGNPYRIENYNITGSAFGILIDGSGAYNGFNVSFIIQNCLIA
ncbi:MAG: hypothetical protein ACFFDS_04950, partial [Candidatus Thorarchaeota archaeon]